MTIASYMLGGFLISLLLARDIYIKMNYRLKLEYMVKLSMIYSDKLKELGEDTHFEESLVHKIIQEEKLDIQRELTVRE